jgi:LuxR family maltose regulon positive regulatory protein
MLLRTRFYLPPLKKTQIARHRLTDKLQHVSPGQLVVISAPAGYGKTTLVSEWLHSYPQSFCWLSLGKEHNSTLVFWRYAISAIQQVAPEIGKLAQELVESGAHAEEILIALLNDLEGLSMMEHQNHSISLVLDDFHYLTDAALLKMINLFVDHLPASVRLVITCRDVPAIHLAKRRACGQLVEINSQQLKFSLQETDSFLNQSALLPEGNKTDGWSKDLLDAVYQGTEGWVTALQLIAISRQMNHSVNQELNAKYHLLDRHIEDYLFEEVFTGLSQQTQAFMKFVAGLPRFCAGLCNQVLGIKDSQGVLLELERANLFLVALDNHRLWFRFHDLFKQFLLQAAKSEVTSNDEHSQSDKYLQACAWFFEAGHLEDAINTAIEHKLWEPACSYLQHYHLVLKESQDSNPSSLNYDWQCLRDWVEALPPSQQQHLSESSGWDFQMQSYTTSSAPSVALNDEATEDDIEPLTKREQQVLALIKQGHSNQDICEQLFISNNTLKVHIRNLYGKMGVSNRREILGNP